MALQNARRGRDVVESLVNPPRWRWVLYELGCEKANTVLPAPAGQDMSVRSASKCDKVANGNGGLHGALLGRKRSCTPPRGTQLHRGTPLCQQHVVFNLLRPRESATKNVREIGGVESRLSGRVEACEDVKACAWDMWWGALDKQDWRHREGEGDVSESESNSEPSFEREGFKPSTSLPRLSFSPPSESENEIGYLIRYILHKNARVLNLSWRVKGKQSKIAQGLGGVKRRKRSRRPPRNASCRMWVRGDPGRVGVEMLKLRASAARSGTGMGSVGRRWSKTVAHASARRKTSHEWPLGSGTRWVRVAKAARKCGVLGNARDERTSLSSKIRGKKSAIRNLRLQ
ncbi:hypothetical protein EDB86DRAFT_3247103 [Lactarius hatsudake]|nr:hypothetical protein EDB86DRAFT_3247103 [Lactarius hatsudake]